MRGNTFPRRRLVRLALLGVVAVAAFLWVARGGLENRLSVENRSGQTLASLKIKVAGETISFDDVPSGESVTSAFPRRGSDRFVIEGRLADGTLVRGTFAPAAGGTAGERPHFIVRPGGGMELR